MNILLCTICFFGVLFFLFSFFSLAFVICCFFTNKETSSIIDISVLTRDRQT